MKKSLGILAAGALVAACSTGPTGPGGPSAEAVLEPTKGSTVGGKVVFSQKGDKVAVFAQVNGLAPGMHGFHIHEKGDCSSGDGMSSGGHFNPTGKPHGNPTAADHHLGDMPQLDADGTGAATLTAELTGISIGGGAGDIVGKAVIVHKDADDFKTQPTGNSGARLACGVIKAK